MRKRGQRSLKRLRSSDIVQGDGTVVLTRRRAAGKDDPVLAGFLQFLANDLSSHPGRIRTLNRKLVTRVRSLVRNTEVGLDEALDPADE